MIVAITGATGYVGRFIVADLQQRGVKVRAWARPNTDIRGFSDEIEWIEGDLHSISSMEALLSGANAVVHAAFEHTEGRYRGGEGADLNAFLSANLMGTLKLLEVAQRANIERFVFISSRAVYGKANAKPEVIETNKKGLEDASTKLSKVEAELKALV